MIALGISAARVPQKCMLSVVLDPFGGSGTTLIACEKAGRSARMVELDPRYVDVIVTRWQEFSGLAATLEHNGRTFDEIKAGPDGVAA